MNTGSIFPPGYGGWVCDFCTAHCNFEAMQWCNHRENPEAECGFDNDQPESLGGCFEFMVKVKPDLCGQSCILPID